MSWHIRRGTRQEGVENGVTSTSPTSASAIAIASILPSAVAILQRSR